jgi:Bacterial Ig domain
LSVDFQITGTGGLAADPDGDALTVAATAPSLGTNAVTTAGNVFIHYQNTNGAPGLDSFTYTVNDGRGGTATGTIAINVVAPGGQLHNTMSAPEILGAGPDVRLTFLGVPADNYALDWTHDLSPVILWLPLVTNMAGTNGLVVYTNTPAVITPDFYRTRLVP